ncbi:MAG: hypothetical protein QF412_06510 [Planctomycetota bacterium]|jgi:hypothetical protein|nr:hypothetical protein [Planctomycetota bacterium]
MIHSFAWKTSSLAIAMCAFGTTSTAQDTPPSTTAKFDAPVELTADGEPMRGILYPSPTLYDIDGDQKRELLIGDLRGYVRVAQPGAERGSIKWSELEHLKSKDNEKLKLHNW